MAVSPRLDGVDTPRLEQFCQPMSIKKRLQTLSEHTPKSQCTRSSLKTVGGTTRPPLYTLQAEKARSSALPAAHEAAHAHPAPRARCPRGSAGGDAAATGRRGAGAAFHKERRGLRIGGAVAPSPIQVCSGAEPTRLLKT